MLQMYVLVLLSSLAARSLADNYLPILSQISAGNSDCNSEELFGSFDLKTVPQFNALCNIPIPDIEESEFLLENNVVPILCMGLWDVSLRLCKSAKSDLARFDDIFPPSTDKFKEIFGVVISTSKDFSHLDEFCSSTVKKFEIKDAASNETRLWWQILNNQLSDETHCSDICHSNEGRKVHPLCSYIFWSNGVYTNYINNQVDLDGQASSMGEDKKTSKTQKTEKIADQSGKPVPIGLAKNELSSKPTEAITGSDVAPSSAIKTQLEEGVKSNFTDNNIVGVGTVEQVFNNGDQPSVTDTKTGVNPSTDKAKQGLKVDKPKSRHHKIKESTTNSNDTRVLNPAAVNIIPDKTAPSTGQTEVKAEPEASTGAVLSEPHDNVEVNAPVVPEPQKQELESNKAAEGMDEGDFSGPEMTPAGAMDQPIAADKDPQSPYQDEDGEDGDGDDVVIVESNAQPGFHTASNSSNPVVSKTSIAGIANIQQGPLEGDKVYGEGEILIEDHFIEAEDSHFFTYFLCMAVLTIMAYLAFHNKKKLIALAVEGRRTKGGRRRPNSSHYSKLDCSLEEALVSNTTASVTHVLY